MIHHSVIELGMCSICSVVVLLNPVKLMESVFNKLNLQIREDFVKITLKMS